MKRSNVNTKPCNMRHGGMNGLTSLMIVENHTGNICDQNETNKSIKILIYHVIGSGLTAVDGQSGRLQRIPWSRGTA